MSGFEEYDDNQMWKLLEDLTSMDQDLIQSINTDIVCSNVKCESNSFDLDENNTICKECGTVQFKSIDLGAEWRFYGADDNKNSNPTRCGMPTNVFLPKSSLGSIIGNENMSKNYYQLSRIRKYHMWNSMPYKERSLYNVINKLNSKASGGGISPSIIEDAKSLYKQLSEKKNYKR